MINFADIMMNWLTFGLAYLGPDSIMPLASALAAVLGVLLIFWRYIKNLFLKLLKRGKPANAETEADTLVDPDAQDENKKE